MSVKSAFSKFINFHNEPGIYNVISTLFLAFAIWLVINFDAPTVVFFGYGIMILAAIAYRIFSKSKHYESYPLFKDLKGDIVVGLIGVGVWWGAMVLTPYGTIPLPPLPVEILAVSAVAWLVVVLLAPFAEETFTRGSLLPQLTEWFKGKPHIPITAQAFVFTIFHWQVSLRGSLSSQLISAFLFAIFVGIITHWRKSILSAWIIHTLVNAIIIGFVFVTVAI